MAWKVVTLKNSVPADWTTAAHHAARSGWDAWGSGNASEVCTAPPAVNRIEPTKNVTASAPGPTRSTYPGNGPTRKDSAPAAKNSPIQRSRLIARGLHHAHPRAASPGRDDGASQRALLGAPAAEL